MAHRGRTAGNIDRMRVLMHRRSRFKWGGGGVFWDLKRKTSENKGRNRKGEKEKISFFQFILVPFF